MATSRLQKELKKKRPFKTAEEEAVLNLLRTTDQFSNRFGRMLRQFELTASQYNVLRILRGEGKPLPSLAIAERLVQVVPAITGLVDRLEKQELVVRRRCDEDRRVVYIEMTDKAADLLDKIDQPLAELHKSMLGHMTKTELKTLSRLLEKAREPLAEGDS